MDSLPGLEPPARPAGSHPLEAAAKRHVDRLRRLGLLTAEHELAGELVLHLASQVRWAKPYAMAGLSKELREAMAELPKAPAGDQWDELLAAITGADDAQAGDRG